MPMPALEIKRFNPNVTLASLDQIALVYFPSTSPSLDEMSAMRAHLVEAAARAPAGFGLVLVVPQAGGPPDGKARELAAEMFRSLRGRIKVMAAVLEGAGFAAAAKRSVLNMLVSVALGRRVVQVFLSANAGCDWLAGQAKICGVASPGSLEMQACLEAMRRPA